MRRVAVAAVCALALLAGGVDARRHGAGMQAGVIPADLDVASPALPVAEAADAVLHQESKALLFQAAAVPQGEPVDEVEATPNGWVRAASPLCSHAENRKLRACDLKDLRS
jgi:hypothetical protein